jgi:hypothetical protein
LRTRWPGDRGDQDQQHVLPGWTPRKVRTPQSRVVANSNPG